MTLGRFLTTVSVLTLAFAGQSTFAQDADTDDVIIVTGSPIRDSQAAALKAKREADNVIDIVSADTIGRFPDQNLADSLGRLPGLAIERDQGQARYINFRGAPFRYTSIAFDGIDVPGAENGRIPRFDSFPSVITSSVEANKAITPDLPGESVAGFINIKTFDPFARDGLGLSVEAGTGEQDLGGGTVEKLNGRVSWSNENTGIVLFGSHNLREQITDNREFSYTSAGDQLTELDFRSYQIERKDDAYGGTVEFRPDNGFERIFLSHLFTEFVDNEQRNQYVFEFLNPVDLGTSGTDGVVVTRLLEYGKYDNSTTTTTLGADWDMSGWNVEGRLNQTTTENNTFLPIPYSAGGFAMANYDISNLEDPVLDLMDAGGTTAITAGDITYPVTFGLIFAGSLDIDSTKVKLDAEKPVWDSTTLKFGVQYDTREADGNNQTLQFGGFPSTVDIASFDTGNAWDTSFTNSIGGTTFDNIGLREAWASANGGSLTIPAADDQIVAIEEDILAFYGMGTEEFDRGSFVFGARVEMTDYTSAGPAISAEYSDDYINVLPSAHLNYDVSEDVKLRLSASTGVSRPTYNELRASAIVDPTNRVVIGGNPTLDAETSWGGDASLEWYFDNASILSLGLFHREIDNVIYSGSTSVDGGIYLDSAAGQQWTLTGFDNGSNGKLTGIEANLIAQAANVLPEPFDGLGVSGNVTVLESEFKKADGTSVDSLPGTSDLIYNASVFYEKFGLSARLNYQYRDAWLSTTENDGLNEYWDEQQRVDASLRYALPMDFNGASFTLFANGNNLTDESDVRYEGSAATPNQVEAYGSRWMVGIRGDY